MNWIKFKCESRVYFVQMNKSRVTLLHLPDDEPETLNEAFPLSQRLRRFPHDFSSPWTLLYQNKYPFLWNHQSSQLIHFMNILCLWHESPGIRTWMTRFRAGFPWRRPPVAPSADPEHDVQTGSDLIISFRFMNGYWPETTKIERIWNLYWWNRYRFFDSSSTDSFN